MIRLVQILPRDVSEKWGLIEDWVKSAVGVDISFTADDAKKSCESGKVLLWIIYKNEIATGFVTVSFNRSPQGITACAPWLGGKELGEWVAEVFEQLKVWLRGKGCISFSWMGRDAWKKLLKVDSRQSFYIINL